MDITNLIWNVAPLDVQRAQPEQLAEYNLQRGTRASPNSLSAMIGGVSSKNFGNRHNSKLAFQETRDGLSLLVGGMRVFQVYFYGGGDPYESPSWISEFLWYHKTRKSDFWFHLNTDLPNRLSPTIKEQITQRLLTRAASTPYSMLTWFYLNKWRKRLGITKLDLQARTGMHWYVSTLGVVPTSIRFVTTAPWMTLISALCTPNLFSDFGEAPVPEAPMVIERYSTKVEQYLPVNVNRPKIMGIELELTARNGEIDTALAYAHKHLKRHAIFKADASVGSGFETVTIPEVIAVHKKVLQPFFEEGLSNLMEATSNCGIHIHMTRKGLSFLQLGRMLELLNRTENQGYIAKVAGRTSRYALPDPGNTLKHVAYYFNNQSYNFGNRYSILNLQNQHTVELRAFKSTTDFKEMCRFLEFADAIRDYTTTGVFDKSVKEPMKWEDFVSWVNFQRKEYPNLVTFHKGL
jgi:hypothetical protein